MFNKTISDLAENIVKDPKFAISYDQACKLVSIPDGTIDLVINAGKIRDKYKKNNVFTCAIINAKSGFCSEDCAFCPQSSHHETGVKTYPMVGGEEIVERAIRMQEAGATNFSMVTSGFMLDEREIEIVTNATAEIKRKADLRVCGSV